MKDDGKGGGGGGPLEGPDAGKVGWEICESAGGEYDLERDLSLRESYIRLCVGEECRSLP